MGLPNEGSIRDCHALRTARKRGWRATKSGAGARLLGAAANLHEAIGAPLRPMEQPRYQATIATVRAQLDEVTYARAYAEGYAMTRDQADAFALAQFDKP